MKRWFFILLLVLFCPNLQAQTRANGGFTAVKSTKIDLIVNDIAVVQRTMDTLLIRASIVPNSYILSSKNLRIEIHTDSIRYSQLLQQIKELGYVSHESSTSNIQFYDIQYAMDEIAILKKEKELYENLLNRIDSAEQLKHFEYWEKVIELNKLISEKEIILKRQESIRTLYSIAVYFSKEEIIGESYNDSWINMPGFEVSYLKTEQPKSKVTPNYMVGYSLKYMMNYKKTYALFSLYKSPVAETKATINELYMFGFGQDFYSKRLGRGQRKFFNLYTSFNTGMYIASSELTKNLSWFINPFIGLEIYKSKNIILDNKVGYFLPYKDNRHQRGFLYALSFNFVL